VLSRFFKIPGLTLAHYKHFSDYWDMEILKEIRSYENVWATQDRAVVIGNLKDIFPLISFTPVTHTYVEKSHILGPQLLDETPVEYEVRKTTLLRELITGVSGPQS